MCVLRGNLREKKIGLSEKEKSLWIDIIFFDPTLPSSRNWFENMKEIKNVKPRVPYSREMKTKNPIYNMQHDCDDDDDK